MKLLIFTYAPAGLGHLRVTDALADSRPKDTKYVLLGSIDKFVTWVHRFTSLNSFGKTIFLTMQYGLAEDIFTKVYRFLLIHTAGGLYRQLKDIILKNSEVNDVWIVATHFGMAHQIGALKARLIKETGKNIKLVVQVTDDTSQHIWCVAGADLTFVPSLYTKHKFEKYAKENKIEFVSEVIPYPLSPILSSEIPHSKEFRATVFEKKQNEIRIAVPISGAYVGLPYLMDLIRNLAKISRRFEFWVLVRRSPLAKMFVSVLSKIPGVIVVVGKNDGEMVNLYELLYQQNMIHLEITKPSEQAFKAIISPRRVGGSVLLFTQPLGRQEMENMEFLKRHDLVAGVGAKYKTDISGPSSPRAIKLPTDPVLAAKYILWAADNGVFAKMTKNFHFATRSLQSGEVGPDGAKLFWEKVQSRFVN